jgi:hypothetical protein
MNPEDLVGCEVVAVTAHHDYVTIIFDNGYKVEVSIPCGGCAEDAIQECD